jgi:hypothetical protein
MQHHRTYLERMHEFEYPHGYPQIARIDEGCEDDLLACGQGVHMYIGYLIPF